MRVSSFLAKLRTLILSVFSISLLGISIATDYIFRHENERQARLELERAGLQANVSGIIKAIKEKKLELFENYDTAGISFGGVDKQGMTPLHFAILEKDDAALEQLFLRQDQIEPSIDAASTDGFTPVKRALEQRDYDLADRLINDLGAELPIEKSPGLPWLIDAMKTEDTVLRDYILNKKLDVNARGSQPHNALAIAAGVDDLDLMDRLVSLGAKVNVNGVSGKPLLIESALDDEYEEMTFLLENGANPDVSMDDRDPLTIAMAKQDGRMKDLLLKHEATIDRAGPSGKHFLFEAYETDQHDWMVYLLDSGISIDLKDKDGDSLFLKAMKNQDYRMVDFLINRKADINQTDAKGNTPLQLAIASGNTAMVRTLVETGAEITPLPMMATAYKNRDNPTMNLLINAGVDPNIELDGTGQRVFDVAVTDNAVDTVRTLIHAKADIGDNFWKALRASQDELVIMFMKHGIDPSKPNSDGQTALDYVLREKRFEMVKPILDSGGHTSPMYDGNESWLSRTIRNKNSDIALALIQSGISLGDERAGDGHSLLGWAIANELDDVTLALIERGVDPNIIEPCPAHDSFVEAFDESATFRKLLKNDKKCRPLMMTSVKRNHEVAQALVNAGGKNYPSSKYYYPVSIASWYADTRMMQILYGRDPDVQPRKLVVDLSRQQVKLYSNGTVTRTSVCSTGKKGYRTKTGTFVITQKNRDHVSSIYDAPMPYFMRLSCADFGFHTGNCPGYPASHGCIRLPNSTASYLYSVCKLGDLVVIQD